MSVKSPPIADQPAKVAPLKRKRDLGDLRTAILFLLPSLLGFSVFFVWPTIRGFYLSFTNYDGGNRPAKWIGLANYQQMLHDPVLAKSLLVTLEYVVINIVFQTILALVIALLMQKIGIGSISFFGSSTWVIPTIALVNVWRYMGYTALLIFAGLQTIPASVYEAASLDGAGEVKQFFKITLPLLRPVLVLVLITSVTGSFQVFDTVSVTSKGGPANASNVIQYYIVDQAFNRSHFGYGSAVSVLLFVILIVVALVQFRVLRGRESDLA